MHPRTPSRASLDLLDDLHDVLVHEDMILADALRPVLCRLAPQQRILELLDEVLVDLVAEVLDGALAPAANRLLFQWKSGQG
jgi:hypothetical protein